MAEGCRNSAADFRTIGVDVIKIVVAIAKFIKSSFKHLRRSDGFI